MDVWTLKISAIGLIFLTGIVGGTMPLRIKLGAVGRRRMSFGNAFSAGVFLGAGLLHMLPDSVEQFALFAGDIDYPMPALLCAAGFLLILFLEKGFLGGREGLEDLSAQRVFYPFVLLVVLSLHSLIAGTSLGLETHLVASLAIFIAIIAHKGAAAFSLGVSLRQGGFPRSRHIGLVTLFSIMVPIGVLLGALFASDIGGRMDTEFEGIFDALAAGTFIYVGVLEILPDVFGGVENRWAKLCLILAGFGLMALIALWT